MAKGIITRFVLNRQGVRELLQSAQIMAACREKAEEIASGLGEGYEVSTRVGQNRVNASIGAVSPKARAENLKHNTLVRAISGGGKS